MEKPFQGVSHLARLPRLLGIPPTYLQPPFFPDVYPDPLLDCSLYVLTIRIGPLTFKYDIILGLHIPEFDCDSLSIHIFRRFLSWLDDLMHCGEY